jgi:putative sterol carrier protein
MALHCGMVVQCTHSGRTDVSADSIEETLETGLPRLNRLGAVVSFDLGTDGAWVIDARGPKATLAAAEDCDDVDPDCTLRLSRANLEKLLQGRMDPMLGYAMGKIKVSGSLGIAMKMVNAIS